MLLRSARNRGNVRTAAIHFLWWHQTQKRNRKWNVLLLFFVLRVSLLFLFLLCFALFSFGTVYKRKWNEEKVALKIYNKFTAPNDTEAQNFFNFRNDYVVGFRGICCSLNALVMEYCKYGSVQSWFKKGQLTEELKLLICYDCAQGMQVFSLPMPFNLTRLLLFPPFKRHHPPWFETRQFASHFIFHGKSTGNGEAFTLRNVKKFH